MKKNPFAPPDPNAPLPPPPPEPQRPSRGRKKPTRGDHDGGDEGGGAGGPGGPGGPRNSKGDPISREELVAASKTSFGFGALLILALLGTQLPLPYMLVSFLFIAAALVYGVRALRRSWAISSRNMMTPMLIMGIVMALLMSVTMITKLTVWSIEMEHQECMRYAITNTAQNECTAAYQKALEDRLTSLRGGTAGD